MHNLRDITLNPLTTTLLSKEERLGVHHKPMTGGGGRTAYIHRWGTVELSNQPKTAGGVGVLGLSTRVDSTTTQKPKTDRGVGLREPESLTPTEG
jgi:hypothetical protein